MTSMNSIPENLINLIGEQTAKENHKLKMLEAQLSEVKHRRQLLSDINMYIRKDWPQHILSLFSKESQALNKICNDNPLIKEALEVIHNIAKETATMLQRRFPAFLDEACKAHNLPLDRESRDPRYTFERGFLTLEIDYQKGSARLSDYEGKLDEFPADIGAIVDIVQREYQRVFGEAFDGQKLLRKLRNNYLAILKKEGGADGSAVPIRRITTRLGKNEKSFRTDEFIIQLSRLIEKGPFEIDNRQLDLQQTKDSNQGIYIHGLAGRGYIGYLTFKEVK